MVTSGMYRMAMLDPTIHALKYRLLNQSFCFGPALTTNSQKQSSGMGRRVSTENGHLELMEITRYLRDG